MVQIFLFILFCSINFIIVSVNKFKSNINKNDHKILNYIQIPNLPENPTNEDIYNYYKLTKKEIYLITRLLS